MEKLKIGYAMCGSFCTFDVNIARINALVESGHDVTPIMSYSACSIDTRFGEASEFVSEIELICGKKIINTISGAEPIGPKNLLDILVVSPCTGNTLAKLTHSITDTPVLMAVKSHLRNGKPVLIAVSTNDALGGNAENLGALMGRKNYYFVPLRQDDSANKPASMISDVTLIPQAITAAMQGKQMQPLMLRPK
ncbi:MAG: dipicolinate synthase subunit B [Oscillospiraceae bacterium]|nr:dipicolinate synthase subunit B [Oscillospiraceae bacterium]